MPSLQYPATDFLDGIELRKDGGIVVDQHLRATDGVYAAGDIAYAPFSFTNEPLRIEHWRTAQQQGREAVHNMAGKEIEFDGVTFFRTRQFDAGLLYVGHAPTWDEIIYVDDIAALGELMRLGRMPTPAQLRDGTANFLS